MSGTKIRELSENVWAFLDKAGTLFARMEEERFRQEMHANCLECGMQSPIEDLFWIAMVLRCKAEYEAFNPTPELVDGRVVYPHGVYVNPQSKIGPYRVDFLVTREPCLEVQRTEPVVVELDGHAFHDKDKRQRAYEKARDRFLVKNGCRVLHYTGSEIVADPFKVAHEVMCLLNAAGTPIYDPSDPLGLGERE